MSIVAESLLWFPPSIQSCDQALFYFYVHAEMRAQQAEGLTVIAQTQRYYLLNGGVFQLRLVRFCVGSTDKIALTSYDIVIPGAYSIFIPPTNLRGIEVAQRGEWCKKKPQSTNFALVFFTYFKNFEDYSEMMLLWTLYLYNDAMDLCRWLEAYLGRAKFQLTQGKKNIFLHPNETPSLISQMPLIRESRYTFAHIEFVSS